MVVWNLGLFLRHTTSPGSILYHQALIFPPTRPDLGSLLKITMLLATGYRRSELMRVMLVFRSDRPGRDERWDESVTNQWCGRDA